MQDLAKQEQKILTPISRDDLIDVLHDAYVVNYNREPSDKQLTLAWAQISLENTLGEVVWNHNLGNLAPIFHRSQKWYLHSHLAIYRSFDTFLEAGSAYWSVIETCWPAAQAFKRGLPRDAAHALKICNYYGADETVYTNLLSTLSWLAQTYVRRHKEQQQIDYLVIEHKNTHLYTSSKVYTDNVMICLDS